MIYMGAKTRLMDRIKPIIESFLNSKTAAYVEPFCGGMNSISKINFGNKIASDNNKYLIAMWEALVKGHRFSHTCSKDLYDKLRKQYRGLQKFGFTDAEIGWYGFVASFNGRFYDGGYSGNYKLVNRDKVAFADLMAEMTPEEVQDCKFKSNMIIRLADMIECYSLEIEDILENYMLDAKIKLFDKIRDAGKGAKEVIDYLGTTTGDFQMDIAETNDELRVKVESLVKMIKR